MKTNQIHTKLCAAGLTALAICLAGCETTNPEGKSESSAASASAGASASASTAAHPFPARYQATDGRVIGIGPSSASANGVTFKEPHMDKCWLASDFNFNGYDTLYIAPTLSTAKFHDDEITPHQLCLQNIPIELKRELDARGVFGKVVLSESEIPAGAKVLKLENTIIEYTKGGGAARYWVGLYGGGQPAFRVVGKMTSGDKTVFTYEARRSGVSGGARLGGAWMKDEDIQIEDVRSLALDFSDFAAAVSGKYTPKK
jgi:hypothetical protein